MVAVHDLHYWTVTSGFRALSCHLEVASDEESQRAMVSVARLVRDRFGVQHVTLQPETAALHEAIECCEFPDVTLQLLSNPSAMGRAADPKQGQAAEGPSLRPAAPV